MGDDRLYETNPIYTLYEKGFIYINIIIYFIIIPLFYIRCKLDDINNIKKRDPTLKNNIYMYRYIIAFIFIFLLPFIYTLWAYLYPNPNDLGASGFFGFLLLIISSIITIISYLFYFYNMYKKNEKYSFNERVFLYSFIFLIVFNILYIITLMYGYIPKEKLLKNKDELKKIRKIIREEK
tara:strand:- start:13708 stop:14247 length:540 start_codon:yes stop_codon:yes gene_type:complete